MKITEPLFAPGLSRSLSSFKSCLYKSCQCKPIAAQACIVVLLLSGGLLSCSSDKPHSPTATNDASQPASTDGTVSSANSTSGTTKDSGVDLFDGDGPLLNYTTNNASALPEVVRKAGRYHATLTNNNDNITLHFNKRQGRLDAKRLSFPFEFIARNVGIGTLADSQEPPSPDDFPDPSKLYMFAGIQVHVLDLEKRDSAHFVVGHRGGTSYTVEGKNTVGGSSKVNDAGQGIVPSGKADLRVVGHKNKTLSWYWQQPNMDTDAQADDWIAYRGDGTFPGRQAVFENDVYIGLITYAFTASSVPFVGTADSIEWIAGED